MKSARVCSSVRVAALLCFAFSALPASALPASIQEACDASNLVGLWKLVSETPVVDPSETAVSAEYLELRSGLLFWVTQPAEGPRTRSRHRAYFAGSKVEVQPFLDRAPQILRCTLRGRSLTLLTASSDGQRRGRLEFRRTGS